MKLFARVALLLSLVASPVGASTGPTKWLTLPVSYRVFAHPSINGVSPFDPTGLAAVQAAFQVWTPQASPPVTCTSWQSQFSGTFSMPSGPAAINGNDGLNTVMWFGGMQWAGGSGTISLSTSTYMTTNQELIDSDVQLNDNVTWSTTGLNTAFDVQSVLAHEAGEFMGLTSGGSPNAVMNNLFIQGTTRRALAASDITDVCTQYPAAGFDGGVFFDAGTSVDAGSSDAGRPDAGSVDAGSAPGDGGLCDFCTRDADCASGLCFVDGQRAFCTTNCNTANDCGIGAQCRQLAMSIPKVCVPTGPCSNQCTTTNQCPLGFVCAAGECRATGLPGTSCALTSFCTACSVCVPNAVGATCLPCCGGGGACTGCGISTCAAGLCQASGLEQVCLNGFDGGVQGVDAGVTFDAGSSFDAGEPFDAGLTASDAGTALVDAGTSSGRDAGVTTPTPPKPCGCSTGLDGALVWLAAALLVRRAKQNAPPR